jgi:hypothetical protein
MTRRVDRMFSSILCVETGGQFVCGFVTGLSKIVLWRFTSIYGLLYTAHRIFAANPRPNPLQTTPLSGIRIVIVQWHNFRFHLQQRRTANIRWMLDNVGSLWIFWISKRDANIAFQKNTMATAQRGQGRLLHNGGEGALQLSLTVLRKWYPNGQCMEVVTANRCRFPTSNL